MNLLLDELSTTSPSDANILIKFKSENNRVYHFFKWQFKSYWTGSIKEDSSSYSMMSGIMAPHIFFNDNTNISAAFRGPDPNAIFVMLTPTYYFDEINNLNYSGYRVYHKNSQRGSVVNERTIMNPKTYDGMLSEDFNVKFQTSISSEVYNVRVLRLKTLIDIMAQIMGLLAGMAFISRFAKFLLMKCNVWVHLDREYNIYFKDDHRSSVTLNSPDQKKVIERGSDFWEPSYPFSNKVIPSFNAPEPFDNYMQNERSSTKNHLHTIFDRNNMQNINFVNEMPKYDELKEEAEETKKY